MLKYSCWVKYKGDKMEVSILETAQALMPILAIILVATVSAGLTMYMGKKSAIQANCASVFVSSAMIFQVVGAPYIILLGLITVVAALIILNIVIMVLRNR